MLQEISTAMRVGIRPVIFLLDNGQYVIEEQIHQGPYNKLLRWDYCAFARAVSGGLDNLYTAKVRLIWHSHGSCHGLPCAM